ncbi:glycerophosphodiester phosphodiesterase family protein [Zavarzinia sp.]|uniref:glycerophosphodiester phosphodiesterase family protein n=1 Tax=Zavarzinia sp. TaxID=2027920 RepID=UPI003562A212
MMPDWLTRVPVAHRGLHDKAKGIPENSRAAFLAAAEAGYAIELDIQVSADGVPMVFHDDTLPRLTGETGRVDERPAAELSALHLFGTAETIPTLAEVLALVGGRVPFLIEVKAARGKVGPLEAATAAALADYRGRFAVQSFNPQSLLWFRRHAPQVRRGQIAMDFRMDDEPLKLHEKWVLTHMLFNRFVRPHFIAYDINAVPNRATRRARAQGLPLLTWTVRTPAERKRAADFADNIIFEGFRP